VRVLGDVATVEVKRKLGLPSRLFNCSVGKKWGYKMSPVILRLLCEREVEDTRCLE
jgi:hypothetical protein